MFDLKKYNLELYNSDYIAKRLRSTFYVVTYIDTSVLNCKPQTTSLEFGGKKQDNIAKIGIY